MEEMLRDALAGRTVIVNIGQIDGAFKAALNRELRAGRLIKWRGKWFPVTGASWGIGSDKTCYGTAAMRASLS